MFQEIQPISITPRAAAEIKKIMHTKGIPEEYALRVGVKGGGCSFSWLIGFDKYKEGDIAYTIDGIPILVSKKHTLYIIGRSVDFYEGPDKRGFTFVDSQSSKEEGSST